MLPEWAVTLAVGLLGGGSLTALVGYWVLRRNRKAEAGKTEAEATEVIGKAWKTLMDEMRSRITEMECKINNLESALDEKEKRIHELECEVVDLRRFIENLGHEPPRPGLAIQATVRRKGKAL